MNVSKLKGKIVEEGKTYKDVAKNLGISTKTFGIKMKNGVFSIEQAQKMIDFLKIKNPEEYFFN